METSLKQVELLETIAKHTETKPNWYIAVSGKSSSISTIFSPPLEFPPDCDYEMACCSVETYYSFPNIDATNNSLKISLDNGSTWKVLRVPIGCYELHAINATLQRKVVENGGKENDLCITANLNTLSSVLTLKQKIQVDFHGADGSLRSVLGFDEKIYKVGRHESEHLVNILRVNSIFVHCDVITLSRKNGVASPIIYNFFPNVSPGEKIVSRPKTLIYLPLSLNVISQMTAWLADQNGALLDLRGEELTITFHMRAC